MAAATSPDRTCGWMVGSRARCSRAQPAMTLAASRMPIDAIIFDCDGTLVDSEPLGFAAMVRTARDCGIVVASDDELLHLKGQSMTSCLKALERMSGRLLPPDFEARVR